MPKCGLTYENKYLMGQIIDCFCDGIHWYIEFIQSHRPEVAFPDSGDKCELGLRKG